jgi:CRISPR/Cas system-associated endoribonuclease Cas2
MRKGNINYEPEVWFFLKAVWEAVPKISFPKLCEMVSELLQKAVPTPSCVYKRCHAEKWTKNIRGYCKKADRTLEKVSSRLFEELKKEYEKIQQDKKDFALITQGQLPAKSGVSDYTFETLEKVANKNRKTVEVLLEHRRRTGKIGQLLDDSMDWMYEAKEAVMSEADKTPEEMERARRQFGLLEQIVEKIEIFSRTAKNLLQADFLLFGINTDDTRDSDSSDRMQHIKDDSKFDQARHDLEVQYVEMQQQVQWIQSGAFESEVLQAMEEKMRKEEAEDVEFYEHEGSQSDDD